MPAKPSKTRLILTLLLFVLVVANSVMIIDIQKRLRKQELAEAEKNRPAEVELTIITAPDCQECFDIEEVIAQLKKTNLKIKSEKTIDVSSDEAASLIRQYTIVKTPTFLARGELEKNSDVKNFLDAIGRVADDGTFVATNVGPPYFDPISGAIKGKFFVTYLTDKSCKECYEVTLHRQVLQNFGMRAAGEEFVDRLDKAGKDLIAKYKITSVPTIILSGDLKEYSAFEQVWPQVGTVESDGVYVFRQGQDIMGVYRDLKTGQLKNLKTEEPKN